MVKRDTPGRLRCIDIYFWTMMIILLSSQIMSTTTLCVDYDAELDNGWSEFFMIKSLFIITTVLIEHTIISIIVLPVFYKQINYSSIICFAIFLCFMFEIILIYRVFIIIQQNDWKENNSERWRNVMISYFTCFEMVLYAGLIGEIFHQAFLMRTRAKAYIRQSINTNEESKDESRLDSSNRN